MKLEPRLRLIEARKHRQWSQQEVASRLGTTQHNVSRWERGATTPTAYFRAKLCALFDHPPQELGLMEQASPSPGASTIANAEPTPRHSPCTEEATTLWAVPYPRNPFFLGHDEELAQIRHRLQAGQVMALSQPQAISGLGGIGKTQLALEYAYRCSQDYQVVLWARAESAESLISSYVAFAHLLALPERGEQEQAVIVEAVKCWLHTHHDWLLILDNADELSILPDFLPSPLAGQLLITTRAAATGRLAHRIQIEILPPEQGALLLLRRAGQLAPAADLSQASSEEQVLALHISEELGGLPLALDQAGAYLEETGTALAAYWQLYQQHRAELLGERRGGFVADHPLPVAATWSLSFQRIAAHNPAAADLLKLLAWLPAEAIAEEILSAGAALLGPGLASIAGNALQLNQAIEALRASSLIRREPQAQVLSIHRLVQAVLQDQQDEAERYIWAERVILAINEAFPEVEATMLGRDDAIWPQCERLLPPALSAAAHIEHYQMLFEKAGRLLSKTASYLFQRARYREAEPLCQQALPIFEHCLGPEHPQVASLLNTLAGLYLEQGKHAEAEPLYQRARSILEQQLGLEHLDVARPLNNLAALYVRQGRYKEAEPLYQRALYICEQQGGAKLLLTAYLLTNLADLSIQQGRYAEAEPHLRHALSIQEQQLGLTHLQIAYPLSILARLYCEQGKYEQVEVFLQRALHIYEQRLGPEHPDVVYSLSELASLYVEQSKYEQAESLAQRALHISEQRLGPEHPHVAYALGILARLSHQQGKYREAEPLFQRAISICSQMGLEHLYMAYLLNNLASFYREQGKHEEAERLYQQVLSIREQQLGPDHPDTAESLHDFAMFREQQGHHQEALALYECALAIREQALGPDHPKTRATRERLTALRALIGQEAGAPPEDSISPEQGGQHS